MEDPTLAPDVRRGRQHALAVGQALFVTFLWATSWVLIKVHVGRQLARDASGRLGGATGLTATSMLIGAVALIAVGVALEGWPRLDGRGWLIIGWLAVVNTAFAFTLWNHTLRTLTAVESSVVNNTMTVQIAALAIVFLGERLEPLQLIGLLLAATGAAVVQLAPVLRRN